MLGFGAIGQFAIGEVGVSGTGAESITVDKWYQRLSEPVRFKIGLPAAAQQFSAFDPQPFVSFSWFEGLSEPRRTKPRSPAAMAPFHFWQPAPSPFVATGWFSPLSEPVRTKPGLRAAQQQFFTTDTAVIPVSRMLDGWFSALSEPVRFKSGLAAARQQFLAAPSQLRPNPTITAIMDALETKDVFLAGAARWNTAVSGEIGVVESKSQAGEVGVQTPVIAGGSISIRIL